MHAVPIGATTRIENDGKPYLEWFARGALRLPYPRPPFAVNHIELGGTRVGYVVRLIDAPMWVDAVAQIDDSPAGDAFLEGIGGDGGRLPVSIAFKALDGGTVRRPADPVNRLPGLQRTRVELRDIAVVDAAQYEGAYTYARGHWAAMMAIGRRDR